jgi:RHS repeat-associated protein
MIGLAICAVSWLFMTFLILGSARQSQGQFAPGSEADAMHPSGAPDPMKVDQIWQVDPITGALNLKIPFGTTPQGGRGPKIPFALSYNSSSTVTLQANGTDVMGSSLGLHCDESPSAQLSCEFTGTYTNAAIPTEVLQNYVWSTTPVGTAWGPSGPWITTGPFYYYSFQTFPNATITFGNNGGNEIVQNGCTINGPYIYVDENGGAHDMNLNDIFNVTPENDDMTGPCFLPGATTGMTEDGSALVTSISSPFILYPNGTKLTTSPYTLEDSNGNMATLSKDSLGRTPFTTNIPIGAPGPISVGTYSFATTAATGAEESYSVVFKSIPLGSFAMPHPANQSEVDTPAGYCLVICPTASGIEVLPARSTINGVTSITLPNGTSYGFDYDPTYGTISQINFPTGGYVRFVYGIRADGGGYGPFDYLSTLTVTDAYISDGVTGEKHWQYQFPSYVAGSGHLTSTVIAPDGTSTQYVGAPYHYDAFSDASSAPTWKEVYHANYSTSGTLVKSVATSYYSAGVFPTQIVTTVYGGANNLQQQVQLAYDPYFNVTAKYESGFYPCTGSPCPAASSPSSGWLRQTFTIYQYQNNSSWVSANMVNKPSLVLVTDGSGHPYSLGQYGYDQTAVTGTAGYVSHDDTNYGVSSTLPRGNLTTESHCTALSTSAIFTAATASTAASACTGSWLSTTHTYDLAGQVTSTTDPRNFKTSFSYTDNYALGTTPGPTDGYVTTVTAPQPLAFTDTFTYNYYPGQLASHTDWNRNTTNYSYADPGNMNRLTKTQYPDGGGSTITYSDGPPPSISVTTSTGQTSGSIIRTTKYDGLGRVVETQLNSDPDGPDYIDTTYDGNGRVYTVSNPSRTTPATPVTTYYPYDPLNRIQTITNTDGTTKKFTYAGNIVTSTDEIGNQWARTSDGLGRLTAVQEPSGTAQSPSMVTDYTYDPLNNLLSVAQLGGPTASGITRNRSFTYDGLSRLLSATNPETGTATYSYDANGNVLSKISPAVNASSGTQTISYCYDALNRVTYKFYPGASVSCSSPTGYAASYSYDTSSLSGTANTVGRLTDEKAFLGGTLTSESSPYNYDSMGRLQGEQQNPFSPAGINYQFLYGYDLAGDLICANNGFANVTSASSCSPFTATASSILENFTYDAAGRLQGGGTSIIPSTFTPAASFPTTLLQANATSPAAYDPMGHLVNAQLGVGSSGGTPAIQMTRVYDIRGRISSEVDSGLDPSDATGSITFSGSEKSLPNYASASFAFTGAEQTLSTETYATATLTVSGAEQSITSGGTTTYDSGVVVAMIYVNGSNQPPCEGEATYGQTSTPASLASAIVASINGPYSQCTNGVSASVNGAVINLTAKVSGTSGDDGLTIEGSHSSSFPSPSFTVTPSASTLTNGTSDTGGFVVDIFPGSGAGPCTGTVTYGSSSTVTTLAAALASSINGSSACSSLVTATASGSTTFVFAKTTGTAPNSYGVSSAMTGYDSASFTSPSFQLTPSGTTMTGGGTSTYDGGLFIVDVGGDSPIQINYGQNSTAQSLASYLANLLTCSAGWNVSGSANGGTVMLTSCTDGASYDYPFSAYFDGNLSSLFTPPSFSVSTSSSSMNGGEVNSSPITIYSYQAGYAVNSNLTSVSDSVIGNWTYSYDHLNRLASSQNTAVTSVSSQFSGIDGCWTYDPFGNRVSEAMSTTPCSNLPPLKSWATYTGTNNNRMDTTNLNANQANDYDSAGNVLYDGANQYLYDAEGRICAVQTTVNGTTLINGYFYEANGTRVAKGSLLSWPSSCNAPPAALGFNVTNQYLLGLAGEQVTELNGTITNGAFGVVHTNFFAGGKLLATYDYPASGESGLHFALTDPLGTKRVQVSPLGAAELDCLSLPFGNNIGNSPVSDCIQMPGSAGAADATEHQFTGKERDSESGNDYFGKRYYASSMGRWMSPDLVNVTEERMMNPANTLNKYAYAADNPLKFVDPDGQDITYFYDPGGLAGHAVLFAYDQKNGDSAIESFGPKVHSPVWAGTGNFDMDEFHSAQGLRDNYASVTIQTTPELAQQVIDYIREHPDPAVWTMLGPNCSSEVQKILAQFKLANDKSFWPGMTPKSLWYSLMGRYNPSQAIWGQMTKPAQGKDYGNPQFDMYALFWNQIDQGQKATVKVTATNCVTGSDGQQHCDTQ